MQHTDTKPRSVSIMQHTATFVTTCNDEKERKRQAGLRAPAAAASMGTPSVEALAMAGSVDDWPWPGECADDGDGLPAQEHLRSFEAFLEEVVPVDMVMASRREEDARVRCGGKRRGYDEDVKEKLKLWAKAVVKKALGHSRPAGN